MREVMRTDMGIIYYIGRYYTLFASLIAARYLMTFEIFVTWPHAIFDFGFYAKLTLKPHTRFRIILLPLLMLMLSSRNTYAIRVAAAPHHYHAAKTAYTSLPSSRLKRLVAAARMPASPFAFSTTRDVITYSIIITSLVSQAAPISRWSLKFNLGVKYSR